MKKLWLGALIFWLGCGTAPKKEIEGIDPIPAVVESQAKELTVAQTLFEKGQLNEAEASYVEFQKKHEGSVFEQSAKLGQARVIYYQGHFARSAELYREVVAATRATRPRIASLALFEMSFPYESLGDEARVLASLKDAQKLAEYLAPEISKAEIPARLAAAYQRIGRTKEAEKELAQAEIGVKELRAAEGTKLSPTFLARIYFEMGSFSTDQLGHENLQASLDTLRMVQRFTLRSIEMQGAPWSERAGEQLKRGYRDLWNMTMSIPINHSLEKGAAEREKTDRQIYFAGIILELAEELKQAKAPISDKSNPQLDEVFGFLQKLENRGSQFLRDARVETPLSDESQKKNSIKMEDVKLEGP